MSKDMVNKPIGLSPCRAEGFAMIIVMGALAVLFIVALSLNAALNREVGMASVFKNEVQAELATRSAVEKALAIIGGSAATPETIQNRILNNPADFKDIKIGPAIAEISYLPSEESKVYGLQDEEGKINVNKASEDLLARLDPVGPRLAKEIVKSRAQDRFDLLEELLSLSGVTRGLFFGGNGRKGLRDLMTVWGDGKININTAFGKVLSALPGISPKLAASIIELRKGPDGKLGTQDDGIRDIGALFGAGMVEERYRAELVNLIKLRSNFFSARALARVMSGPKLIVQKSAIAVLDSSAKPPKIVYWSGL